MASKPDVYRVIYFALEDGQRVVSDIHEANNVPFLYRWARGFQRSAMKRTDLPDWARPVSAHFARLSRYTDRKGRIHRGQERPDARLSALFSSLYQPDRTTPRGARAELFALAAACRQRGEYTDARLILADLRDERQRRGLTVGGAR